MDIALISFFTNNWMMVLLFAGVLWPIIPPRFLGLQDTYFDTFRKREMKAQKYSVIRAIIHGILSPLQEVIVMWGLRGTVSLVIFAVLGIDLILRKSLSSESVFLVTIGIIALYLEQLILNGKKIKIGFFEWQKADNPESSSLPTPTEESVD